LLPKMKEDSRKLYTKLLLGIVLCTVLTLVISSTILFFIFNRIALNQVYQSDLGNLTQTSREVVNMTESAQSLTFQLYRNSSVAKLLFYAEPTIYDQVAAMGELQNYLNSMPYIESIYVYNPNSAYFYISSNSGQNGMLARGELNDKDILRLLDRFQDYKPFSPIPRTYRTADGEADKEVYTYLCYDAIGTNNELNSAVIVNISSSWINKDIGNHQAEKGGNSFIIDSGGTVVSGEGIGPRGGAANGENSGENNGESSGGKRRGKNGDDELIRTIAAKEEAGYFVRKVNGVRSLVSYTKPDSLEWRYVRVTPYSLVTEKVNSMRELTILIALGILVVGLFASWLLSRRLYEPIGQMASRMRMLENDKRNNLFTLRQQLLRSLVHGVEALNPKTLRGKMAELGIEFNFQQDYRVALLRIDRFKEFAEEKGSDLRVYKYAIMNIATELCMQSFQTETVDMDGDSLLLLLGTKPIGEQGDEELLRSILLQIQRAVREHLKTEISVTYSGPDNQALHLHAMYRQVRDASMHRLFIGHCSMIRTQDITLLQAKNYVFPADKEKKLVEALLSGRTADAKQAYAQIVGETASYPFHVAQSALSHLTMTLNGVLHTLQRNHSLEFEYGSDLTMPPIEQFETIAEIDAIFYGLFDEIHAKLAEKRSMKHEDLIRRINELIQRHYANPNLSLNWLADELDLSPSYVGRVYKQITMKAPVDVIASVRMEKALELLSQTHRSIAEIAELTGFTNSSYFYRMFKKHFGQTPTDFRRNAAGGGEESLEA